jgi:4-amino-4-deoxy-L-arabinose transferase-like glycosyltransferase
MQIQDQKRGDLLENATFFMIALASLAVRVYQLITVCSISGDGPVYIEIAKNFSQGNLGAGLRFDYPPLYPLFISVAHSVTHDWLLAGRLVSFILGNLTILPIYFMTKELFGRKIAHLTTVLFAFHPYLCMYPARVLPEATYIFLFVCAVWFGWKAISQDRHSLYLLAGAVAGLNYLVKPEGLGVAVGTSVYALLESFFCLRTTLKRRLISICVLVLGTLIFVSPYVLYVRSETGKWQLSKKKSILAAVAGRPIGNSVPDMSVPSLARMPGYSRLDGGVYQMPGYSWMERGGYLPTLVGFMIVFVLAYDRLLFLFLLVGLIRRRVVPRFGKYDLFAILLIIFHILVFALFYVTAKYLVALICISLFWAALGLGELYQLMLPKISTIETKTISKTSKVIYVTLLTVVLLSLLPDCLRIQDRDKIGKKRVGLWMKANCLQSPLILTDSMRLAYYAEAKALRFRNRPGIGTYNDLIQFIRSSKERIDYVVIDKATIGRYCQDFLDEVKSSDLVAIHVQPKLEHSAYGELIVYEVKQ